MKLLMLALLFPVIAAAQDPVKPVVLPANQKIAELQTGDLAAHTDLMKAKGEEMKALHSRMLALQQQRADMATMMSKKQELLKEAAEDDAQVGKLQKQMQDLASAIEKIDKQLNALKGTIEKLRDEIDQLKKAAELKTAEIEKRKDEAKEKTKKEEAAPTFSKLQELVKSVSESERNSVYQSQAWKYFSGLNNTDTGFKAAVTAARELAKKELADQLAVEALKYKDDLKKNQQAAIALMNKYFQLLAEHHAKAMQ